MNRKQAENILDAYVMLNTVNGDEAEAAWDALRDIILDAMTETRYYPLVTQPFKPTVPAVDPYKPTITWKSEETL